MDEAAKDFIAETDTKADPERVKTETDAANAMYNSEGSNVVSAHNEGVIGDGAGGALPSTAPTTGDVASTSPTGTTGASTSGSSGGSTTGG